MFLSKSFIATSVLKTVPNFMVQRSFVRNSVINYLKQILNNAMDASPPDNYPPEVWKDKVRVLQGLVYSLERAEKKGCISTGVFRRLVDSLIINSVFNNDVMNTDLSMEERNPFLVLISPTRKCNLRCTGCYANSDGTHRDHLDFDTFDRILNEKRQLWGSCFTAISGGEPFLWKSKGKNLLDLAERHNDEYFMVYTNGTLIDDETAARLEQLGNVTPAISVEGYEAETDARRGKGVFRKILKAFERLRHYGVPFGISVTGTRHNWEAITSDEFIDYYFYEQGVFYGWLFQYMPIGRSTDLDLMVPPAERVKMWERSWDLVTRKKVFYADFWNSATASSGCISAGRPNGYFHITSNGDITPCVFIPYAAANIYDIYRNGTTINEVFKTPLFKEIRKFQNDYAYDQKQDKVDNWLCPCPTRDHHNKFQEILKKTQPRPLDEGAETAMNDPGYIKGMTDYGKQLYDLSRPIWESRYLEPEKKEKEVTAGENA